MPTTIIGVDFSGARGDRNTWVAQGVLSDGGALWLHSARSTPRADLYRLLASIPTPAVAALDFPFGVPRQFANYLSDERPAGFAPAAMPEVWRIVSGMGKDGFIAARNRFVGRFGEPKRAGDQKYFSESYSPLHAVNPNMLPMTCLGIDMLHRWHDALPNRWHVPPLAPPGRPDDAVTLLETMPGAFLRAIGLPYRGYKKGRNARQLRQTILDGLAESSGVPLANLDARRGDCMANDDCLDSVVAAVAAAAWALDSGRFRRPDADELADAQLEGWIYVPRRAD